MKQTSQLPNSKVGRTNGQTDGRGRTDGRSEGRNDVKYLSKNTYDGIFESLSFFPPLHSSHSPLPSTRTVLSLFIVAAVLVALASLSLCRSCWSGCGTKASSISSPPANSSAAKDQPWSKLKINISSLTEPPWNTSAVSITTPID